MGGSGCGGAGGFGSSGWGGLGCSSMGSSFSSLPCGGTRGWRLITAAEAVLETNGPVSFLTTA